MSEDKKTVRPRGFAAIPKEVVQAIASKGGKAAHVQGTAHKWNHEEAVAAGRKGGRAAHERRASRQPTDASEEQKA